MVALQISELKSFMNKLFIGDAFDSFELSEATFVTFSTFHIDGALKRDYYTAEELAEHYPPQQLCCTWKQVRPFCLDLIKGKRTPLEFKLVLRLSADNLQKLLAASAPSLSAADVSGLFLNLHYHENKMTCTTGTALTFFTMDKTLDRIWDDMVKRFLTKKEISFDC